MPALPKDNFLMDRPYSGRAILYVLLRESKGEPVTMRQYQKAIKAAGRTITAFPRVLYWVGKAVEEYGYDLETTQDDDKEITSIRLVKRSASEEKPSKRKSKPSKSKSKSSKKEKPAKKTSKKSSKKTSKRSKKDESESESESKESESESAPESEDESSEA